VDALHASIATWENPLQLIYIELVGIGLKDGFPTLQTDYGDGVDVRMLLETLHRMDNDGAAIDVHKLLGYVLTHAVSAATCDNQSYVFLHRIVFLVFPVSLLYHTERVDDAYNCSLLVSNDKSMDVVFP
jgi:hypothetical protein